MWSTLARPGGCRHCIRARSCARNSSIRWACRPTLAKALCVPLNRITAILAGERAISADTALRLGRFFGMTPEFWINLQGAYDLEVARLEHGREIAAEVRSGPQLPRRAELEAR